MHTFSYRKAAKFYWPLVIQAAAQSFTYPLVATVITHDGANGVADFSAYAMGQAVMFVLNAFCGAILTTAMVYGKTKVGFARTRQLTFLGVLVSVSIQALCSMNPFRYWIFGGLLNLPPEAIHVASRSLLYCIPVNIAFFYRNIYLAILYNAFKTAKANAATVGRIIVTLMLAYAFVNIFNYTGYVAGVVAFTLPSIGECFVTYILARKYMRALPPGDASKDTLAEQFMFSLPLAFGIVFLAITGFMVAAFISHAHDPLRMLPIHYMAMGVINPITFGALRMREVAITFASSDPADQQRLLIFTLSGGAVLGCLMLLWQIPCIASFYFGKVQNLNAEDIPLAMSTMLVACLAPVLQVLRGHAEGTAAHLKRPNAIFAGQIAYLAALVCTLFVQLRAGVPGYLMGAIAGLFAISAAWLTTRMGLLWTRFESYAERIRERMEN